MRVWLYICVFVIMCVTCVLQVNAQTTLPKDSFYIIPEAEGWKSSPTEYVKNVMDCTKWASGYVPIRDCYNQELQKIKAGWGNVLWYQLATGIISRDGILFYIAYLIRFLSQLGMVVGAIMIIYTGYLYSLSAITGTNQWNLSSTITNIIIWLLLITASYGILKLITTMFL